ncbi:MAG: DUF4032 domain-containing protein [Anaerolineales bacterium]|nr:DUF4032 domain-containing protein [Anaerolineales bacterium]
MPDLAFNISLRPEHPDFLDLPWDQPLDSWGKHCQRLVEVERGISRHIVVFVNYNGMLYAIKELPKDVAEKEYNALRDMQALHVPVVNPVGHVEFAERSASMLITQYLERALPYLTLFKRPGLEGYLNHLQDAMAGLLVQLHLAGVYWGDCSLSNALFRRDAGTLQAYLVDAETSEVHEKLEPTLRLQDLEIMNENISGGLADLEAEGELPEGFSIYETAPRIRNRYHSLWQEITQPQIISPHERYRIQQRINALNKLGFSISEIELQPAPDGEKLRFRVFVTDRNYHSTQLSSLTGLDAEEMQARHIISEIQEQKATLSARYNRSTPLSVAAYRWLNDTYMPISKQLQPLADANNDPIELYCQVLENKWYLSEQAHQDVGHQTAVEDLLQRYHQTEAE